MNPLMSRMYQQGSESQMLFLGLIGILSSIYYILIKAGMLAMPNFLVESYFLIFFAGFTLIGGIIMMIKALSHSRF